EVLQTLPAPAEALLAFTPDGKTLVTFSRAHDEEISRWGLADGKKLSSAPAHADVPGAGAVLSPDGKTLARRWVESPRIGVYDAETGKPRHPETGHPRSITALAFSPDGKYLASSDRYVTKLWDLATASEVATWQKSPAHRLVFSPDGKVLALAGMTSVCVHRVPDGKQLHVLDAKAQQGVESVAFSPDGSLIAATGGGDSSPAWRVTAGTDAHRLRY